MGAHDGQAQHWVAPGGAHGCSWWVGATLGFWGAPGGAHGVLIQHVMVYHSVRGRSFGQGQVVQPR